MVDWIASGARFLAFLGLLVSIGASTFFALALRPSARDQPDSDAGWQRVLLLVAIGSASVGSILWLLAEAAAVGTTSSYAVDWSALKSVVVATTFGRIAATRCVVLVIAWLLLWFVKTGRSATWIATAWISAIVVASLAWTGHGHSDSGYVGWIHLGNDIFHLLTAGLWLGALMALSWMALAARRGPTIGASDDFVYGLRRFSALGIPLVAVLVLSGIINSWLLIGAQFWRALLATTYGEVLCFKVVLFAGMLALAATNRRRLALIHRDANMPAAGHCVGPEMFIKPLLIESALGIGVIAVVAILGTLEPPAY